MFTNKSRVIVGLTTYYIENLMISLSGLARLAKRAVLVIYNDNPETPLSKRDVRRMGYEGEVYIINSEHNVGLLRARMEIIDFVKKHKISSDWFVFANDDDVLLNVDVPNIGQNHFAIIQNMAVVRSRLIDVLRIIHNPDNYTINDENIYLVRPHIGMIGTLVRMEYIIKLADVLRNAAVAISDVDESLGFRPPVDAMMWSALNIVARSDNENVTPIYMDTVNYIAMDIDNVSMKYGMLIQPEKNPQAQIMAAVAKYDMAVRAAIMNATYSVTDTNDAENAAPVGHESDAE
mgnify:CR=1 FL=1